MNFSNELLRRRVGRMHHQAARRRMRAAIALRRMPMGIKTKAAIRMSIQRSLRGGSSDMAGLRFRVNSFRLVGVGAHEFSRRRRVVRIGLAVCNRPRISAAGRFSALQKIFELLDSVCHFQIGEEARIRLKDQCRIH